MILRRIAAAFRRQDWFTVAVETLIVVFGVFIGLQVNNWNEMRAERARAQGYLERIRADLGADIVQYQQNVAFWQTVSDYGERALDYAETGDAKGASAWDLLLAFFQASQVNEVILTETTYVEMKSAGELGLVWNIDLRGQLGRYYALRVNPTTVESPLYRTQVREKIPIKIQTYIWDSCYATNVDDAQEIRTCRSPVGDAAAAAIVVQLGADDALMGKLRYWLSTQRVATLIVRDRIVRAQQLQSMIDDDLSRMKGTRRTESP